MAAAIENAVLAVWKVHMASVANTAAASAPRAPALILTVSEDAPTCTAALVDVLRRRLRLSIDVHVTSAIDIHSATPVLTEINTVYEVATARPPYHHRWSQARSAVRNNGHDGHEADTSVNLSGVRLSPAGLVGYSERLHVCAGKTCKWQLHPVLGADGRRITGLHFQQ